MSAPKMQVIGGIRVRPEDVDTVEERYGVTAEAEKAVEPKNKARKSASTKAAKSSDEE